MIPAISEGAIRDRVGDRSFERGRAYAADGSIFETRREGGTLKARCHGSSGEIYRLHTTIGDDGAMADADCSCPVGGGGFCKHVAALLLTWLAAPEQFVEQEPLESVLERRSKSELIMLVKQMLRAEPDLESFLDLPRPKAGGQAQVTAEAVKKRALGVFRNANVHDWRASYGVAHQLTAIASTGESHLAQGDVSSAVNVYTGMVEAIAGGYGTLHDEEGEIGRCIDDCVEGIERCLDQAGDDAALRARALRVLFDAYMFDISLGGVGFAERAPTVMADHATPAERTTVAQWVREALPAPADDWSTRWRREHLGGLLLDLEHDRLDDESYLRICRETGRVADLVDRLLALERVDEAVAATQAVDDPASIHLANLFVQHGQVDAAEQLVLARLPHAVHTVPHQWLLAHYEARGNLEAALGMARKAFALRPALDTYGAMRRLAAALGDGWDTLRPGLLRVFRERRDTDTLLAVYLAEGEVDEAIALLKRRPRPEGRGYTGLYGWGSSSSFGPGYSTSRALQVAEAAEQTRPAEALEIFRDVAELLIEQRGREKYQEAAGLLTRVRALHERLGTNDAWAAYIAALRDRTRPLRALKQELANAGL